MRNKTAILLIALVIVVSGVIVWAADAALPGNGRFDITVAPGWTMDPAWTLVNSRAECTVTRTTTALRSDALIGPGRYRLTFRASALTPDTFALLDWMNFTALTVDSRRPWIEVAVYVIEAAPFRLVFTACGSGRIALDDVSLTLVEPGGVMGLYCW